MIYTLASLAYAIFTFDPSDTATTIIQGFGVALATTIIGLVLRVYFSQSRPDLAESETSARLELAAASGKLKAELSRSIVNMNDFSRQTRQSLEELRDEIFVSLQTVKDAAELAVRDMSQQATSTVTDHADAAVSRSKKLSTATDKVVSGMENHVATLSGLEAAQAHIAASLSALQEAAGSSQTILGNLVAQSRDIGRLQTGASETVRDLAETATSLRDHVAGLTASTAKLEGVLVEKITEVQAVPRSVADAAISGLEGALERVRADLQQIVDAQGVLVASLADQVKQGVGTASRHNDALEAEIAKSRENVAKVHTALVDMTGQLAVRAETRVG